MTTPPNTTGFTERILEELNEKFIHKTYPFLGGQRNYIKGLKDRKDEMFILGELGDFIKTIPSRLIQELKERMPKMAHDKTDLCEFCNKEVEYSGIGYNQALSEVYQILDSYITK